MPEFKRSTRVSEGIRVEISRVIQEGTLHDPEVGYVTITDVVATDDLREAKVYTSVYGEPAAQAKSIAALNRAASFIRRELGPRLQLRYTPALTFVLDVSLEHGARIEGLLKRIEKGQTDDSVLSPMPDALVVSTGRENAPVVAPPPVKKPAPKRKSRSRR